MAALSGLAKRHPLIGFFGLAYALSWWPWLWMRLDPTAVYDPVLRFGPLLAAAIMLALVGGRTAVGAWFRNIVAWRVGLPWYAVALLLPAAITAVAVGVNLVLGAEMPPDAVLPDWGELVFRFAVVFLAVGLGEEPAWRGFALPRLIEGRTPLVAALILGFLLALWHLPLYGVGFDLASLWPWLLSVLSISIVIAWMWLATNGNLLLPALFRASVSTTAFAWGWFADGDQLRLWWIWAGLWMAAAAIVVTAFGLALASPSRA